MTKQRRGEYIQSEEFVDQRVVSKVLEENVFQYCKFSDFSYEGAHIDAVFLGCSFLNLDWYWGLFNSCLFIDTRFESCIFRGTHFSGCKFVDSKFEKCQFLRDNLNGACQTNDISLCGTSFVGCSGTSGLFNGLL